MRACMTAPRWPKLVYLMKSVRTSGFGTRAFGQPSGTSLRSEVGCFLQTRSRAVAAFTLIELMEPMDSTTNANAVRSGCYQPMPCLRERLHSQ
jgi:hypothetical protein